MSDGPPPPPGGGQPRPGEEPASLPPSDVPPPQPAPPPLPPVADPPVPPPLPPAAPTTDDDDERALFHVTESTRTYPCHQCGDQLVFDITTQRLACPSCGASQEIAEDEGPGPAERDLRTALADLRQRGEAAVATTQVEGEKEIVCQSCGGHTTFSGTLTATRCPYCATPIQRDDVHDAPDRLPVDGVVPFRVDEDHARAVVEEWVSGRWFAPNEFKKYKRTGSFTSLYAAYFTYDADTVTVYRGRRGDHYTVTVGSGQNRRTETRTRWRSVSGTVGNRFDDLAVLANDGLDRQRVTELEPWPTQTARSFSPEYVAGHLCRTYDNDVSECFGEANRRMDDVIATTVRRDIGGDVQQIHSSSTDFRTLAYKHLMLPIWLLTVIYEQRPFQVFINGVTGEVQGRRPWSKVKIAAAVVAAIIAVIVAVVIYNAVSGGSSTTGTGA